MADASPFPARTPETPGFPNSPFSATFDTFNGLNTKPSRPAIDPEQCYILDNWMPLGKSNARTLYDHGTALYTAPNGLTIKFFGWYNIQTASYAVVFLSDGSIVQVSTRSVTSQIAPAGTVINPSGTIGFSQWGSQYLLFSADQPNGYWVWDGTSLYTAGTLGPTTYILQSGAGYNSTNTPTVGVFGGEGTGAVFTPTFTNGALTKVTCTNPGTGYQSGDVAVLTFSGGGGAGTVSAVTVLIHGSGYTSAPTVVFTGGGGTGAAATAVMSGGGVASVNVTSPGSGYTGTPTVTFVGGGGSGAAAFVGISTGASNTASTATATVTLTGQSVTTGAATIVSAGYGYTASTVLEFIGGGGTGCTGTATIGVGGTITGLNITHGGSGYTNPPTVVFYDAASSLPAVTITAMPFGVSGTAIETYEQHVWIANGTANSTAQGPYSRVLFSAPSSVSDFGTPDGGGAFLSTDSFTKVGYTTLRQTNGFLYLLGDSSINTISQVSTSTPSGSTVATTGYQNQNQDPQIGTSWPYSTQVYSRNLIFANSFGVHVSYGGSVARVSQPLDGIYNTVSNFNGFNPSSALATLFGIPCYMLLLPIVDQVTGQVTNKLLLWDSQKWFTASPSVPLSFITTQEINSTLTAWGTDGNSLYPLFQTPSTATTKTIQSPFYADAGYIYTKTATRLVGAVDYYNPAGGTLTVSVDNETNTTDNNTLTLTAGGISWTNNSGTAITWKNTFNGTISWSTSGIVVFPPYAIGQSGAYLGLTLSTNCADMALLSLGIIGQTYKVNI